MDISKNTVTVAIVQEPPVFLNCSESMKKALSLIDEATDKGAEVVAFPETWLPGYPVWLDSSPRAALWGYAPAKALYRLLVRNSLKIPDDLFTLCEKAQKTKAQIIMGAHELSGGTLYNSQIFIDTSGEFSIHRKIMPTYTERLVWGRGDGSTLKVMPTEYGNIGGLICWEHWMPLVRAVMHAQHEVVHVAQWPSVGELHQIASRHYAFEGQCFVIAAGCFLTKKDLIEGFSSLESDEKQAFELLEAISGEESKTLLNGGSGVIGPTTGYVEGPIFEKSCIIYADLELDLVSEGHLFMDTDGHYSRPDIFRLEVNDEALSNVTFKSRKREREK